MNFVFVVVLGVCSDWLATEELKNNIYEVLTPFDMIPQ